MSPAVTIVSDLQTTKVYLKDEGGVDQRTKTLTGLRWGREYCISIKVEANGGLSASHVSDQKCLLLPEQGKKPKEANNHFRLNTHKIPSVNALKS